MNIRRVKEADLENLLSLYEHLHQDDIIPSKEILNKTWQTIIKHSDFFIYLIAEKDGKIVSSCNLSIVPNLTRGSKPFGLIENVITHKDYRNQGIGKMIIKHILEIAINNNCYKVMLLSNERRKEAHKFYESLGFSATDKIGYAIKFNSPHS